MQVKVSGPPQLSAASRACLRSFDITLVIAIIVVRCSCHTMIYYYDMRDLVRGVPQQHSSRGLNSKLQASD